VTIIDESNFKEFISRGPAVIMFTSPWCTACKQVGAAFQGLMEKWSDRFSFGTCDISVSTALASRLAILSLPTILVFNTETTVNRLTGTNTRMTLSKALQEAL
jgi:thioredoxin-like negative regulator of GroEL